MNFLPPVILPLKNKEDLKGILLELGADPETIPLEWVDFPPILIQITGLTLEDSQIFSRETSKFGVVMVSVPDDGEQEKILLLGGESRISPLLENLEKISPDLRELFRWIQDGLIHLNSPLKPSFFRGKEFTWGSRTFIMGIINLTPDSFSGDGLSNLTDRALERAFEMISQGADIIDVGAESTRPGSTPVSKEEEWERLELFLKEFVPHSPVPVSLDTYKWEIAQKGLELGVSLINDVWGLKKSPQIARLVADYGAGLILMHNKEQPVYQAFLPEVLQGLEKSVEIALRAGVPREKIIVDPGFGFGKTAEHGYYMLKHLETFRSLGFPLLIGISRKSFIGKITGKPPSERVFGTAAFCALAIERGCDILRVHDVPQIKEVSLVCDRLLRQRDLI
ncbi:MAG: dihydropteroate synthase [Caldiserica bacterium]|jgi:dihydropteroate synthase|nr:dihydropteroate synthase [Caldisericota bacterium]MDH7562680.1 dihydropteroate synthase [Caldisericota bacterium]